MLKIRKKEEMGRFENDWLSAFYHFSFSRYYDANFSGFGDLLVINDDTVHKGKGFLPHFHDNMEIITIVKSGTLWHEEADIGRVAVPSGFIQVVCAGTGVTHSAIADEAEDVKLLQIWILPNKNGLKPTHNIKKWDEGRDGVSLLASNEGDNASVLKINSKARISVIDTSNSLSVKVLGKAYFVMISGEASFNELLAQDGDGIFAQDVELEIKATAHSKILFLDNL